MFCSKCGRDNANDALVCASCGFSLAGPGPSASGSGIQAGTDEPSPQTGASVDSSEPVSGGAAQSVDAEPMATEAAQPMATTADAVPQTATVTYAGFWRRFVAVIFDTIVLFGVGAVAGFILGAGLGVFLTSSGIDQPAMVAALGLPFYLFGLGLNWLYYTLMESSSKGATLGKIVMGLAVTDLDGKQISFGRANGRYWGKILSAMFLMIGYLMAGFTAKKQALHDMLAGTLVIKK